MANPSIYSAIERLWQHVNALMGNKQDKIKGVRGQVMGFDANGNPVAQAKPAYTADEVGALPNTTAIPDSLSDLSEDSTHRVVTDTEKAAWNAKSNFSGNYNDLTNKPTIPSIAGLATEGYVDQSVANLVNSAPEKLNTLDELAQALGDDPNFATTITGLIGEKATKTEVQGHINNKNNPHEVNLSQLGITATATELNYVDGTTGNIQTQLNNKQNKINGIQGQVVGFDINGNLIAQDIDLGAPSTIIEQNKNLEIKIWMGTSAEYQAITTIDPNTLYYVTDEDTTNLSHAETVGF